MIIVIGFDDWFDFVNKFLCTVTLCGILNDVALKTRLQFTLTVTTIIVVGVVVITLRLDFDAITTDLLTSIGSEVHEVMSSACTSLSFTDERNFTCYITSFAYEWSITLLLNKSAIVEKLRNGERRITTFHIII